MAVIRLFIALFAAVLVSTAAIAFAPTNAFAQDSQLDWSVTSMDFTPAEGQLLDSARDPLTGDLWVSFMVSDPPGIAVCQQSEAGGEFGGGGWLCNGPFDIGDRGSSPSSIDVFHTEDQFRVGLVYLTQQRFESNEVVYRSRDCSLNESCLWSDAQPIVRGETDIDNPEFSNYQYLDARIKFDGSGEPNVTFVTYSVVGEIEVASLAHPSGLSLSCLGTVSNWTCAHVAETSGIRSVDIDIDVENNIHLLHYGLSSWQIMQFVGSEAGNCLAAGSFDCSALFGFGGFFSLDAPSNGEESFPVRFAYVADDRLVLAEQQADGNCGGSVWDEPGSFRCTEIEPVGSGGEPFLDFTNNPDLISDPAGRPVVVYKDLDGDSPGLKIAAPVEFWQAYGFSEGNCGDGQWFCDQIAGGVDGEVAVELDRDGRPVVFFHDDQSLRIASLQFASEPADEEESTAPVDQSDDRDEKKDGGEPPSDDQRPGGG